MQPTPYTPTTDFSEEEADGTGGRSTVRTSALDAELDAIEETLDQILANLALIQRDDTELADLCVELHTLSGSVRALFATASATPRGDWLTATAYALGDLVTQGTGTYICATAHTSGVFATDLAADKWMVLFDTSAYIATGVAYTPGGTIAATNVQAAISEAASEAMQKADNLSDVASADSAIYNLINAATAEADPAVDDLLALIEASGGATGGRKITLADLLKVVNALTEDADPDATADFALVYDASASAVKKVAPYNFGRSLPQNSKSANYTTVLADAGKHILHPTADNNPRTFTIDSNVNVAYPVGTTITFVNQINTLTIAITGDTMTLMGAGSTGSRTLAANGIATALKVSSTGWVISGTNLS